MKEIISAVLFIVSLWGGTVVLTGIHDSIRKAALEKAAQGMPSLTDFANALSSKKPKPVPSANRPGKSGAGSKIRIESQEMSKSK
ncbi:MAG: hypothetical protein ABTQ25_12495 [Nitrosomonas ureae]